MNEHDDIAIAAKSMLGWIVDITSFCPTFNNGSEDACSLRDFRVCMKQRCVEAGQWVLQRKVALDKNFLIIIIVWKVELDNGDSSSKSDCIDVKKTRIRKFDREIRHRFDTVFLGEIIR
jgi:hypothetical protein